MDEQQINEQGGSAYTKKDGRLGLIRCPKCKQENYAMAVSDGVCCWCGWDANGEDEDENS